MMERLVTSILRQGASVFVSSSRVEPHQYSTRNNPESASQLVAESVDFAGCADGSALLLDRVRFPLRIETERDMIGAKEFASSVKPRALWCAAPVKPRSAKCVDSRGSQRVVWSCWRGISRSPFPKRGRR